MEARCGRGDVCAVHCSLACSSSRTNRACQPLPTACTLFGLWASRQPARPLLQHSSRTNVALAAAQHSTSACLGEVVCVEGEAVVDALWQHHHRALLHPNADPPVLQVPHIKVACTQYSSSTKGCKSGTYVQGLPALAYQSGAGDACAYACARAPGGNLLTLCYFLFVFSKKAGGTQASGAKAQPGAGASCRAPACPRTAAVQHISDFLVGVQVLLEEALELQGARSGGICLML